MTFIPGEKGDLSSKPYYLRPPDSTVKYDIFKPPFKKGGKKAVQALDIPDPDDDGRDDALSHIRVLREDRRRTFRSSLFAFAKYCLGYNWLEPEVHGPLCELLQDLYWGRRDNITPGSVQRTLILMPRGSLKTTICTIAYPIWILIQNEVPTTDLPPGVDPSLAWDITNLPQSFNGKKGHDQRILISSETQSNARRFLANIKDNLQTSDVLKEHFGQVAPVKRVEGLWTTEQANIQWRQDMRPKEANLTAASLEQAVNSGHYDIGINDDIISDKTVTTPEQIEKSIQYYRSQLPLLDKPALQIFIGTRWHDQDLYGHFQEAPEEKGKWDVVIERAERTEEQVQAGKRRFYFPQRLGGSVLEDLRTSMRPDFFSAQYNNEPLDPETALFKPSYFDHAYYDYRKLSQPQFERWIKSLAIFSTADPAISEDKAACYAVIVTCGWDSKGTCWVLDLFRKQGVNPDAFLEEYFRQYIKWSPLLCGIEEKGFQRMYRFNAQRMSEERNVWLPWIELKPDGRKKEYRIGALEPVARAGRLKILAEHAPVENEAIRFPKGKYKDTLDALAYQTDLAFNPARRKQPEGVGNINDIETLAKKSLSEEYSARRRELIRDEVYAGDWYND